MKKHNIFSTFIDLDAYDDCEEFQDLPEEQKYTWAVEDNHFAMECEIANLNKIVPGIPVYIANLGLWNGRRRGYRTESCTKSIGEMLQEISYNHDDFDWYCADGDLRVAAHHHDGTNYFTLRYIPAAEKQEIIDQIMEGEISLEEMLKHTKSLEPLVNEVYGWSSTAENPQEIAESMPA